LETDREFCTQFFSLAQRNPIWNGSATDFEFLEYLLEEEVSWGGYRHPYQLNRITPAIDPLNKIR
jgi:hypothetical protein